MKKSFFLNTAIALFLLASCGNKTQTQSNSVADSASTTTVQTPNVETSQCNVSTTDTVALDIWKTYFKNDPFGLDISEADYLTTYLPMLDVPCRTVASFTFDGEFPAMTLFAAYPLKTGGYYVIYYLADDYVDDEESGPAFYEVATYTFKDGALTPNQNNLPSFDDCDVSQQTADRIWLEPDVCLMDFTPETLTVRRGDGTKVPYKWNGEKFIKQ